MADTIPSGTVYIAPATDSSNTPHDGQDARGGANPSNDDGPRGTFEGELHPGQVIGTAVLAVGAYQSSNWQLVVAAVIMLMIFALDMLWIKRLPDDKRRQVLPWASVGAGVLIQFAVTLHSTQSWGQAFNLALVTSTSASGLWSLVGKQLVGRLAPKEAAANPDRALTSMPSPSDPDVPVAPIPQVPTVPPPA